MSEQPHTPRNRLSGLWSILPIPAEDFACELMGEPVGRPDLAEIQRLPPELMLEVPADDCTGPLPADDGFDDLDEEDVTWRAAFEGPEAEERALLEQLVERFDRDGEEMVLHSLRVGVLAEALARELGASEGAAALLRRAAVLHDVGKLAVAEDILDAPGRLDRIEQTLARLHASAGAYLLAAGDAPVFRLARTVAENHHERWDGSGYPTGRERRETPAAARIVAVADVFDALTHARPYKPAWSLEEAAAELGRQRGLLHDPRVVDALHRVLARAGVQVPSPRSVRAEAPVAPVREAAA